MPQRPARTVGLIILILALAVTLRVGSYVGLVGSDDNVYAELAHTMSTGVFKIAQYDGYPVYALRIGLLAPVALTFKAAGVSELAMTAYPLGLSLLSVLLAFVAGRAFFGNAAGLIAATLYALLPLDVALASRLLPDLPSSFWLTAGVLLLYFGSHQPTAISRFASGLGAGLAFGLSWLTKESLVYVVPFVAGYLAWRMFRERATVMLVLGFGAMLAVVLGAESLLYYSHTGDLFYRLHQTERNYEVASVWFFSEGSSFGWEQGQYWTAVLRRIMWDGPTAILLNWHFGVFIATALVGVAYAVFRRERAFLFPSMWFLVLVLMFNFGSSSLHGYRPLPLSDRYLYPVLFPAVLVTAGLIHTLAHPTKFTGDPLDRERRFWAGLLVLLIACACVVGLIRNIATRVASPVERQVSALLRPDATLLTDSRTAMVLRFFWKYPEFMGTCDFQGMETRDVPDGAYVLINRDRVDFLHSAYGSEPPKYYQEVPTHWQLKWRARRAELYWTSADVPSARAQTGLLNGRQAEVSPLVWRAHLCKTP